VRAETYCCDVCLAKHQTANHWFLAEYGERELILAPWECATDEAIREASLHLCGSECVNKIVAKFLSGKKVH